MAALEASEGAGLIITGSLLEAAGSVVTTGSCEINIRSEGSSTNKSSKKTEAPAK